MRWRGRSFAGTRPFRATEAFSTTRLIIRTCTWRWPPSTWSVVKATRHSRKPLLRVVSTRGGPTHTSCRLSLTTSAIVPDLRPRSWKKLRRFPRTTLGSRTSSRGGCMQPETKRQPRRHYGSSIQWWKQRRSKIRRARSPATFVRAGLLRQSAGIAPLFPPSGYVEGFRLLAQGAYEKAIAAFNEGRATRSPERRRDVARRRHAQGRHRATPGRPSRGTPPLQSRDRTVPRSGRTQAHARSGLQGRRTVHPKHRAADRCRRVESRRRPRPPVAR